MLNTNKVDTTYLNKYNPNDFVIDDDIQKVNIYGVDENVVNCMFRTSRYGYYNGYGLTRTHLGSNLDDDIQACVMEKQDNPYIVWNHHFGYASNQHNYKYVSIWIDNELLFDKATLSGNNVHWSSVPFENNTQRDKWLSKYDNKYHKLHIKYWRSLVSTKKS